MKTYIIGILLILLVHFGLYAQTNSEEKKNEKIINFSGSVDGYYKYDFSGRENIQTSFYDEQDSFSIGMINLIAEKTFNNTTIVADLSWGSRSRASLPNTQAAIQNAYISQKVSEKSTFYFGYMGTFVGYEVISPVNNFHASTSYLFSYGPFQNAGLKWEYSINTKWSIMLGVFNDWNVYKDITSDKTMGVQVHYGNEKNLSLYLNYLTGNDDGTILDLTGEFDVTDSFKLGINAATWGKEDTNGELFKFGETNTYSGIALYSTKKFTKMIALGGRYEHFKTSSTKEATSNTYNSFTLTGHLQKEGVRIVPEFRLDVAKDKQFLDSNGDATDIASQFVVALVANF